MRNINKSSARTIPALLLALALTACIAERPPQTAGGTESPPPTLEEAQVPTPPEPVHPHALSEPLFDFASLEFLPTVPPPFQPELQFIPLTNDWFFFGELVFGPVTFIDRALRQAALPQGIRNDYYFVLEDWDGTVYGYWFDIDGDPVYLDVSGTAFPDFYPEPIWGADMSHYDIQNGYLITAVRTGEDYRQLCGVMDLRTVRDVLPPMYDAVSTGETTIWAMKDGEEFLFDYAGNLLTQSDEHTGSYDAVGIRDLQDLWAYEEQYRTLYLPALSRHDGLVTAYAPKRGLSIFTAAGAHLFSIADTDLWSYYQDTGKLIVRLAQGDLLLVYADGRSRQILLPSEFTNEQLSDFSYENDTLAFTSRHGSYVWQDSEQALTKLEPVYSEPTSCHTHYDGQGGTQLLSPDGDVLFPSGAYDEYALGDSFILAYRGPMDEKGHRQIDVLGSDGTLFLRDVMGTNLWEPSFPGTMVVWLNETSCVLLESDGTATPIPPYTSAKTEYIGW